MKAIISSTYDSKYLYFLPIVTFCWNKLGVDVICFMPHDSDSPEIWERDKVASDLKMKKSWLVQGVLKNNSLRCFIEYFDAPEYKEATYAQCSRLYGACLDFPEDEILIISDCDMANFKIPPYKDDITIWGSDLVPEGQYPMCYAIGTVRDWRSAMKLNFGSTSAQKNAFFKLNVKTYQQCLDSLLGEIECEHMRGNYWGKDQQTLWENICDIAHLIPRARIGTQFADNRVDRDDINWRTYLNENLVDAHLWRNGYQEENHKNIMELLTTMYHNDDFTWLETYRNEYLKLI